MSWWLVLLPVENCIVWRLWKQWSWWDCLPPINHARRLLLIQYVPIMMHMKWHCCVFGGLVLVNLTGIQYIPRNMHTFFVLLCFVVVIHWLIFPYPSDLLHWHCGNLTIAPVPAKQPWWIWINTSCEFIMNDWITTTKQSTTKPCAYFLGYTVLQVYFTGTVARVPMKQPWRIWVKASHQSTRTDVFNEPQHNVYIFVVCNTCNWLLIMLL